MPNLSSQLETIPSTSTSSLNKSSCIGSTSNLNQSALKSVSTSTSTESLDIGSTSNKSVSMPNLSSQETQTPFTSTISLNASGARPKNRFKKFFSRSSSSSSIPKEKPTYTVWDYIRGKPITTEMYTQTPSPTLRDVGIQEFPSTRTVGTQYDPPSSSKSGKKHTKTNFLNIFSRGKSDLNQTSISQEEASSSSNYVKLTTYSHEYRELDRKQIELIKMHQQALQKRLQEHLELLLPDSEQPSTSTSQPSTSTAQNMQTAQLNLMERNLKIQELNEKVQDLKNIKTEIGNIGKILANIEPVKRDARKEALAKETAIQGKVITPQSSPKPKKGLRKFITKL